VVGCGGSADRLVCSASSSRRASRRVHDLRGDPAPWPKHKSNAAEFLQSVTSMPVRQVTGGAGGSEPCAGDSAGHLDQRERRTRSRDTERDDRRRPRSPACSSAGRRCTRSVPQVGTNTPVSREVAPAGLDLYGWGVQAVDDDADSVRPSPRCCIWRAPSWSWRRAARSRALLRAQRQGVLMSDRQAGGGRF
jgi:hypothetical protein